RHVDQSASTRTRIFSRNLPDTMHRFSPNSRVQSSPNAASARPARSAESTSLGQHRKPYQFSHRCEARGAPYESLPSSQLTVLLTCSKSFNPLQPYTPGSPQHDSSPQIKQEPSDSLDKLTIADQNGHETH